MKARINEISTDNNKYQFNYRTRRKLSKAIAQKMKSGTNFVKIKDGDRVKLNYENIVGRNDYNKDGVINEKYKSFVEGNKDKIFTAVEEKIETGESDKNRVMTLFSLKESDISWLFHPVDLIKVVEKIGEVEIENKE